MKKIFLFLIISLLISSCEYFKIMSKKEWEEKVDKEDDVVIYVAGAYDIDPNPPPAEIMKACYWKIIGNDQKRIELESDNTLSAAFSINVIGDNVYTSGYNVKDGIMKACYWINKKIYYLDLENNVISSNATQLKVHNGVIFTCGFQTIFANTTGYYWIDQNKDALNMSIAYSIFIYQISSSKHTIYIGGANSNKQACYWKDGQIIDLENNSASSSAVKSIYVTGNTVYSVGILTIGGVGYACFWKNKELTLLTEGTTANSVFISNEDIYVAGEYILAGITYPRYWKNNKNISLPGSYLGVGSDSLVYSIFVFNDNVYVAGLDDISGGDSIAWYCQNGKKIIIDSFLNAGATAIFVTSNNEK